MGLFSKEVEPSEKEEFFTKKQEEVFARFPIGKRFNFMGVDLIVTSHAYYEPGTSGEFHHRPEQLPEIKTIYVDKKGGFRVFTFEATEIEKLLDNNQSNTKVYTYYNKETHSTENGYIDYKWYKNDITGKIIITECNKDGEKINTIIEE